jgi:hypothetical protein
LNYYVLAVDGKTYGPVDLEGLKQWVREGRIVASTRLRDASTGLDVTASDVPELREQLGFGSPPPGSSWQPVGHRCPYCGGGMAPGQVRCLQCGTVLGQSIQPRSLITGSLTGDRVFGFAVGFLSWLLYGVGALGALILYFVVQRSYPVFARSLGFGLLSIIVVLLGMFALCLVALTGMRW